MIETLGDFLSIAVLIFFFLAGLYYFYAALVAHREYTFRDIETRYYKYYEDADDEDDGQDKNEPYFED